VRIDFGIKKIGEDEPPFIIAEMSANHNGSLTKALELADLAAQAGASALKLQTYTADTMTLDLREREFVINDPNSLWNGKSLYELYQEASTPWEWHKEIFERCKSRGLVCFSTPFDVSAVDFLEGLEPACYKIASFENTDTQLVQKVAKTGRPVLVSTGMATQAELDELVDILKNSGCREFVLLKCCSAYPADVLNANLLTLADIRKRYGCLVGVSDHTMGTAVAVAGVALGAVVVEKHFTDSRTNKGIDSEFSMEPQEMQRLVNECQLAWKAKGRIHYGPTEAERASLQFRRSLYVTADMKKGDVLTSENVRAIRPGSGLPVKFLHQVLGKKVTCDINRGTPLSFELIKRSERKR